MPFARGIYDRPMRKALRRHDVIIQLFLLWTVSREQELIVGNLKR